MVNDEIILLENESSHQGGSSSFKYESDSPNNNKGGNFGLSPGKMLRISNDAKRLSLSTLSLSKRNSLILNLNTNVSYNNNNINEYDDYFQNNNLFNPKLKALTTFFDAYKKGLCDIISKKMPIIRQHSKGGLSLSRKTSKGDEENVELDSIQSYEITKNWKSTLNKRGSFRLSSENG
jgi:hypothetical protein